MFDLLSVLPLLALFGGVALLGVLALADHLRASRRGRVRVHLATARAAARPTPARPHAPALPRVASPHQRWADGELPTQALIAHLTAANAGAGGRHRLADDTPIPEPRTHLSLVPTS